MKNVNVLTMNGINVQGSLELFGDMSVYDETLIEFKNGVNQKLSDIKKYKELLDMPNYAILVHSLKSDARYLGFTKLAELSYNHEMESKANNISYVNEHYNELMMEASRIINVVNQYLGDTQTSVKTEPNNIVLEQDNQNNQNDSLLVVDDSDMIRNFISKIFNNKLNIIMANDGKEALDIINSGDSSIKGVLLDLNMPNVNGFEVLDYFKENSLFSKYPVSIITGDDAKDSVTKAFTYPIIDILPKPFTERDVKRVVEKTLSINN
jgi:CheY-like chemotaxis protein/HPt (histidine-containing phosphotransfer) domain-containing protein